MECLPVITFWKQALNAVLERILCYLLLGLEITGGDVLEEEAVCGTS